MISSRRSLSARETRETRRIRLRIATDSRHPSAIPGDRFPKSRVTLLSVISRSPRSSSRTRDVTFSTPDDSSPSASQNRQKYGTSSRIRSTTSRRVLLTGLKRLRFSKRRRDGPIRAPGQVAILEISRSATATSLPRVYVTYLF